MESKKICLICEFCGKEYFIYKTKNKSRYCSKKCFNLSRFGENNPIHRIKNRTLVNKKISDGVLKSDKYKISIKSPERSEKLRISRLGKKASESTKQKNRENALNTLQKLRDNNKVSKIEKIVESVLLSNNIKYVPQKRILNITIVDFYLPDFNLIIYCDGDYWHNLPNYIERDIRINKKLKENGYNVSRYWEHEILKTHGECVLESLINV